MALLKVRKMSIHGDFLQQLAVTEWESMTTDEMLIHHFSKQSDVNMSQASMKILASDNNTVAAVSTKVTDIETLLWYSTNKNLGKQGIQREKRFRKPFNSFSHWKESCWGECRICQQHGHKTEWCHVSGKEGTLPTTSTSIEAPKAGIKKKKKKAKKAGETAEGTETLVEEVDTDSEYNLDRVFPALKSNGEHVRVVIHLNNINTNIKRPNHPTESGTQV